MATLNEIEAAADAELDRVESPVEESAPVETQTAPESPSETVSEAAAQQEESPSPVSTQAEASEPSEYDKALAKHGGDPMKLARHYWETQTQNARLPELERKIQELQAQVAQSKPASPAEAKTASETAPAPAVAPEIQHFDQRMAALDYEFRGNQTKAVEYQTYVRRLDNQIAGLIRKIRSEDPSMDKFAVERELAEAYDNKVAFERGLESLTQRNQALVNEFTTLEQSKKLAERVLAFERSREAELKNRQEGEYTSIRRNFESAVQKVAQTRNIPPDRLDRFKRLARAAANDYLDNEADENGIPDFEKFVSDFADDFKQMGEQAVRQAATNYSKEKQADVKVNAPTGKKAFAPEEKPRKTIREIQEWADSQPL